MNRHVDDVEGSPKYWHARVWRLAGPAIATNVSVPLLGAVDTAVVGRLPGPEYVGAVAVAALIFSLAYQGCNFLRMGTTGLTAQSFGARDGTEVRTWLARSTILGGGIGILFILLQAPIYELARLIIAPSPAVDPLARDYFDIRIWGAPASLINFAMLGWFLGVQNARAALITQLFLNGVNAALDFWFVLGLGWGVAGVAWATLIAEISAAILSLWIAASMLRRMGGRLDRRALTAAQPIRRMLAVSRDMFLRSLCLQTTFAAMTAIGSRFGDTALAANAVLLHFQIFMAYALDAFSHAAGSLTGAAYGARSRRQFDAAVQVCALWASLFAVVFSLAYAAAGERIVDLVTTVEAVRQTAYLYLPWLVFSPVISIAGFLFDGVFTGCTWSRQMRDSMAFSLVAYLVALAVLTPAYGNHGLWAAFLVLMLARGVSMAWYYRRLVGTVGEA